MLEDCLKHASTPEGKVTDCPWMLQTGISTASQKVDSEEQTYGWTGAYTQIPELSYVQYVEKSPKVSMSGTFWQCNPE